jgi:hypothetical protein
MPVPSDARRGIGPKAIYLAGPEFPQLLLSN